jgi:hypothetical protein
MLTGNLRQVASPTASARPKKCAAQTTARVSDCRRGHASVGPRFASSFRERVAVSRERRVVRFARTSGGARRMPTAPKVRFAAAATGRADSMTSSPTCVGQQAVRPTRSLLGVALTMRSVAFARANHSARPRNVAMIHTILAAFALDSAPIGKLVVATTWIVGRDPRASSRADRASAWQPARMCACQPGAKGLRRLIAARPRQSAARARPECGMVSLG